MHEMRFVVTHDMALYGPFLQISQNPLFSENVIESSLRLMITSHRLHIARSTLQIPLESLRNVKHLDDVFHTERFLFVDSKSLSCADRVFDLLIAGQLDI